MVVAGMPPGMTTTACNQPQLYSYSTPPSVLRMNREQAIQGMSRIGYHEQPYMEREERHYAIQTVRITSACNVDLRLI